MSGFTPGPWRVEDKGRSIFNITAGPDYFERTFVAFTGAGEDIPAEANAHLIAAAPALYEALRDFVAGADSGHVTAEVDRAARAALSLANPEEGQP